MIRYINRNVAIVITLLLLVACSKNDGKIELTVSVAASLTDAMISVAHKFEEEHSDINILLNFGSSGLLQQQIGEGAPVDLFVSAAEDKFILLLEEGRVDKEYATDLLLNSLVLVQGKGADPTISSLSDLQSSNINTIAIGTPELVPAGHYAKEAMESHQIYTSLLKKEKLVFVKDVRSVLTYVETGNVDAGFVYQTDALLSDQIDVVETIETSSHSPIVYPAGVLNDARYHAEAVMFFQFLTSETAMDVFTEYGFLPVNDR